MKRSWVENSVAPTRPTHCCKSCRLRPLACRHVREICVAHDGHTEEELSLRGSQRLILILKRAIYENTNQEGQPNAALPPANIVETTNNALDETVGACEQQSDFCVVRLVCQRTFIGLSLFTSSNTANLHALFSCLSLAKTMDARPDLVATRSSAHGYGIFCSLAAYICWITPDVCRCPAASLPCLQFLSLRYRRPTRW